MEVVRGQNIKWLDILHLRSYQNMERPKTTYNHLKKFNNHLQLSTHLKKFNNHLQLSTTTSNTSTTTRKQSKTI